MVFLAQEKIFTAHPGRTMPKELLENYQRRLVESLKLYFLKFSESAKIDLNHSIDRVGNLDTTRRFSPAIYSVYVHLKDAYQNKDVEDFFLHAQLFNNLTLENFYAEGLEYGTILTESWEPFFIKDLKNTVPHDEEHSTYSHAQLFPLIHWEKRAFPPDSLKRALEVWKNLDPVLYEEFEAYVSSIKLFSSKALTSATSPRYFGSIYLRLPASHENPLLFYLEYLVHEVSHLHLFVMMGEDKMVLNEDSERFASPLRPDKRPMMGIYHATFVLARIVRILRRYIKEYGSAKEAVEILEKRESNFKEGLETVSLHARLTEAGKIVFNSLEACAFE